MVSIVQTVMTQIVPEADKTKAIMLCDEITISQKCGRFVFSGTRYQWKKENAGSIRFCTSNHISVT